MELCTTVSIEMSGLDLVWVGLVSSVARRDT